MPDLQMFAYFIQILIQIDSYRTSSEMAATSRIAGGSGIGVNVSQAPFAVQVITSHQCGGSLVAPLYVVTAAHCVYNVRPSDITVVGGATYFNTGGTRRTVGRIYMPNNLAWDIAVLKLGRALEGSHIATIKLCDTQWREGDLFKVYGWGNTRDYNVPLVISLFDSYATPQLRAVEVPVVGHKECALHYNLKPPNSIFCAGIPGEQNSCGGDSGGPAVFNNQLCGVVSQGGACPDMGLYVNINHVKSFLEKILRRADTFSNSSDLPTLPY